MTEHQDIKEFFEKNAVSYNDKKYSQFSVTTSFAWHPDRILTQKSEDPAVKEMQNAVVALIKNSVGSEVTFFSDAISLAMVDYRHLHNAPCGSVVFVAFSVLTTAGDQLVYTTRLSASVFHQVDYPELFTENIVRPTALKLVSLAMNDVQFENVLSVTAYVGELSSFSSMSVSDYSVLQLDGTSEERS